MKDQTNSQAVGDGSEPMTSDVVRARKFEVVDAASKAGGGFTAVEGGPQLELYDSAGKVMWAAR